MFCLNLYNNINHLADDPKINVAIFLDLSNLLKNDAEINGASFVIIYNASDPLYLFRYLL